MKCPKCGYQRNPHDNTFVPATECPSCGVVYAKSDGDGSWAMSGSSTWSRRQQASPVDEQSLKKARERVEMRLRKQLEHRLRDDRHAQTLERARRIASAEARKRQLKLEMQRQKADPPEGQAPAVLKSAGRPNVPSPDFQNRVESSSASGGQTVPPQEDPAATLKVAETPQREEKTAQVEEVVAEMVASEPQHTAPSHINAATDDALEDQAPAPAGTSISPAGDSDPDLIHIPSSASTEEPFQEETDQESPHGNVIPLSLAADYLRKPKGGSSGSLSRLMPVVAWLILCAGVVGAVLSWTTLSDVQANVQTAAPSLSLNTLPIGLLLGFAYLATGVLGFAFFWVSSLITQQLKDIRHLLLYQRIDMPAENRLPDQLNETVD